MIERPIAKDILFEDGELVWLNGDLVEAESDQVAVDDIICSAKGEWREFPALGVGIVRFLNSDGSINRVSLLRQISIQLQYDEMRVEKLAIDPQTRAIQVQATRLR